MSIQRRMAISITVVLLLSLAVAFGLFYQHVLAKVRTEMHAALVVGADGALNALSGEDDVAGPLGRLRHVVLGFDGDRHIKAVLGDSGGDLIAQSKLLAADEPAPPWFYNIVVSPAEKRTLLLPERYRPFGTLVLAADPHNEIAEAWSDLRLTLTIMGVFFAMVLMLAVLTIRAALAPLREVCVALERIGAGDYSARIEPNVARELAPLRDGVNGMAMHLEEMGGQNRALQEQIMTLQEEERAELARDLHDEVAPFLFAVGADAAMIRQYLAKGEAEEVAPRAEAIAESVRHMQRHLRDVLRRLAPSALVDLGLSGALENLVTFWKARRPLISFSVSVDGDPLDPPLDVIAFRIVQESISNAVRHGRPGTVDISVIVDDDRATIAVEDDGVGFAGGAANPGFGLTGMRERVRSAGGTFAVRNRDGGGAIVEATLPLRRGPVMEQLQTMDVTA